jgi:Tol biopolymer transport system component
MASVVYKGIQVKYAVFPYLNCSACFLSGLSVEMWVIRVLHKVEHRTLDLFLCVQKLSRLGGTRISPDGQSVAFTVTRSDVSKNRGVTNIWMVPAAGGDPQQLTFADRGSNSGLRW